MSVFRSRRRAALLAGGLFSRVVIGAPPPPLPPFDGVTDPDPVVPVGDFPGTVTTQTFSTGATSVLSWNAFTNLSVPAFTAVLVALSVDGNTTISLTGDTDWTLVGEQTIDPTLRLYRWFNHAATPANKSMAMSFGGVEQAACIVHLIPRLTPGLGIAMSATFAAQASTSSPNPPAHDALLVRKHLWLAMTAQSMNSYVTPPAGFGDLVQVRSSSSTAGASVASARKLAETQIDDPGNFVVSGATVAAASATVAVWEGVLALRRLRLAYPVGTVGNIELIGLLDATPTSVIAVTRGALPPGLTLDSAGRMLTGEPTTAGTFQFELTETLAGAVNTGRRTSFLMTVSAGTFATYLTDTISIEGITYQLGSAQMVGWQDARTPFVVNSAGVPVTAMLPASIFYTAQTGAERDGQIHGAIVNPGETGTHRAGTPNRSQDSTSIHALDTRGVPGNMFAGQGVPITPFATGLPGAPVSQAANGTLINRDPGFTGTPLTISAGTAAVIAKARSNPAATVATSRLTEYAQLRVLPAAPPAGAIPVGAAVPSLGTQLTVADIDLTGLPSVPIIAPGAQATDWRVAENRLTFYLQAQRAFDHSVLSGGEVQRYNRARIGGMPEYGRNIGHWLNQLYLLLVADIPDFEKRLISRIIVKQAYQVRNRFDADPATRIINTEIAAQTHQWAALIAWAAWLTRNSAAGQLFRDLLPGGTMFARNTTTIGNQRIVHSRDWTGRAFQEARMAPDAGVHPGYYSVWMRPFMDGLLWTSAGAPPVGNGRLLARMGGGTRPYFWTLYGNALPGFRALAACPGGKATVDLPAFWEMLDYLANTVLHHRQYAGVGTQGSHRFEGMSITTGFQTDLESFAHNQVWPTPQNSNAPPLAWPYEAQPTPALAEVLFCREVDVLYELSNTTNYPWATENWVAVRYNVPVSREEARLPPKTCFTIMVNGQSILIDETAATTVGDPRTNGAIQARWSVIALALSQTDLQAKLGRPNLLPSDVVTLAADYSGLPPANRPATLDGQLLPGFGATAAGLKSAPLERPATLQTVSFGNFANEAADPPKAIFINVITGYRDQKFGLAANDPVRQLLIGIRGKVSPLNGTAFPNTGLIFGRSMTTGDFHIHQVATGGVNFRAHGATLRSASAGPGFFPTSQGLTPIDHTWWLYLEMPNTGGFARVRRDNNAAADSALGGSWATDADCVTLSRLMGGNRISLFGVLDHEFSAQAQPVSYAGMAVREAYIAIGTAARPIATPTLNEAVFAPGFDWGNRGQNVLPGRANYAGRTDGGIPEFYFCPQVDEANERYFPNYGVWGLMAGFFTGPQDAAGAVFVTR